jgi:hypothetical protein
MRTSIRVAVFAVLFTGCGEGSHPASTTGVGGEGGSEDGGSTGTPTGGSTGTPTGGSTGTPTGGSTGTPTGGSTGTPTGGSPATGGSPGTGGAPDTDAGPPPVSDGTPPYGCTKCTRLFDGKTLTGWDTVMGAWVVKDGGILASTGMAADIYTHEDLGDYRVFFQIKHDPAMGGKDHQPCVVLFGKRPADPTKPARSLGGAQFQPPNGYSWNYGVGGTFSSPAGKPMMDAKQWNQCEIVVKAAGSFKAACCAYAPGQPCKTSEVLSWKGPGRMHPLDLMMHNAGLFDEYREIWIERNQTDDSYLSQK